MKLNQYNKIFSNPVIGIIVGLLFFSCNIRNVNAQTASKIRDIAFGTFLNNLPVGSTGVVTISSDEMSVLTSDPGLIIDPGSSHQSACIRVDFIKHDTHHAVTISYDLPTYIKYGNYSILFSPNPSSNSKFIFNSQGNQAGSLDIYIGGSLTIGSPSVNPSGPYSGTFNVYYTYNIN